jgi:hypothetical protein
MNIETIAVVGLFFVTTAIAALVHERRMDVLHGPYIEGFEQRGDVAMKRLVLAPALVDNFRWKARSMIYLGSVIAC